MGSFPILVADGDYYLNFDIVNRKIINFLELS